MARFSTCSKMAQVQENQRWRVAVTACAVATELLRLL